MQKQKRGSTSQQTASDNSATVISWKDNRVVFFTTNCDPKQPEVSVKRYCPDAQRKVVLKQPNCINKYQQSMGGVDRAMGGVDVSTYRIGIRSKKWWWALFAWVPDVIMQNAWLLYRHCRTPSDPKHDLLSFRREVVKVYFAKYKNSSFNANSVAPCTSNTVPNSIRLDKHGHFSESSLTTKRCGLCHKSSRKWCPK